MEIEIAIWFKSSNESLDISKYFSSIRSVRCARVFQTEND